MVAACIRDDAPHLGQAATPEHIRDALSSVRLQLPHHQSPVMGVVSTMGKRTDQSGGKAGQWRSGSVLHGAGRI